MFEWKDESNCVYFAAITRHRILSSFSGLNKFLSGMSAVTIGTHFFLLFFLLDRSHCNVYEGC